MKPRMRVRSGPIHEADVAYRFIDRLHALYHLGDQLLRELLTAIGMSSRPIHNVKLRKKAMASISLNPSLETALKDTTSRIAYFFGAGISVALAQGGPSWECWVRDGIRLLPDADRRADLESMLGDSASVRGNPTAMQLGDTLELLMPQLKAKPSLYNMWMHEAFETRKVRDEPLAKTLEQLLTFQDFFVTTNYDDLLSQATGRAPVSYRQPARVYSMVDGQRNDLIVHLHGRYCSKPDDAEDSIIATDSQYRNLLANEGAQFVQNVIGTRPVIFIGCGKTTDDVNISRFMRFAKEQLALEKTCFFLYRKGEFPTDLPDNVVPICYGDDYGDLPSFLAEMAATRSGAYLESQPFIELYPQAITDEERRAFSDYYFAAETLTFRGRGEELDALSHFLNCNDETLWYAITGQAGAGKSRLALEFCHRHRVEWSSFFIKPYADPSQLDDFVPFRHTLVVIDTCKGQEHSVTRLVEKLFSRFKRFDYKLRLLFLERDTWESTGSWLANLIKAFDSEYQPIFESRQYKGDHGGFIKLGDLEDDEIEALIGEVYERNGLPIDPVRDKRIREDYWSKFEVLRYRPLFVQIFTEAAIESGLYSPRFDTYSDLLESVILREQKRWLQELGIKEEGDDYNLFDHWVRLLLLSCVKGRLTRDAIPEEFRRSFDLIVDFVRTHSAPGKQRRERFIALVSDMCHALEPEESVIEVMYPDLIKEYCFLFYLDETSVVDFSKEVWAYCPEEFVAFLIRVLQDFPLNEIAIAAFDGDEGYRHSLVALITRSTLFSDKVLTGMDDMALRSEWLLKELDFWRDEAMVQENRNEATTFVVIAALRGIMFEFARFRGFLPNALELMFEVLEMILGIRGDKAVTVQKLLVIEEMEHFLTVEEDPGLAQQIQLQARRMIARELDDLEGDPLFDGLTKSRELNELNTKAMNCIIFWSDFTQAYEYLKKAEAIALSSNDPEFVKQFLITCDHIGELAARTGNERFVGRAEFRASQVDGLFEDNDELWCLRNIIRMNRMFYEAVHGKPISDSAKVREIAESAAQMHGMHSNLCLGNAYQILLFAVHDIDELQRFRVAMRHRLDAIEGAESGGERIAEVYLRYGLAIRDKTHGPLFTKEEVEDAYVVMLRYVHKDGVRNAFRQILRRSTEADHADDYLTREVIRRDFHELFSDEDLLEMYGLSESED